MSIVRGDRLAADPQHSTRGRIIRAAQAVMADSGNSAVSLREITGAAGVNVAAVNYHFGSKDALIETAVRDAVGTHAAAELAAMRSLVTATPAATAGDLVEAWVLPLLTEGGEEPAHMGARISAIAATSNQPAMARILAEEYAEFRKQFLSYLAERLPHLSFDELDARLSMALKILLGLLPRFPLTDDLHETGMTQRCAVAFIAGGLTAP